MGIKGHFRDFFSFGSLHLCVNLARTLCLGYGRVT